MAFHTLNINNSFFELAPFKVKAPVTETSGNYFIPFLSGNPGIMTVNNQTGLHDVNPSSIYIAGNPIKGAGGKFYYNPSSNILTVGNVKITGTNSSTATIKADAATNMYVDIGGNVPLVIKYDSTDKFIACGSSFSNLINLGTSARKWAAVHATKFYGALSGNASTASKLQTARNIKLTEAIVGDANFDGSANITITTHLPNKSATASSAGWYRIAATAVGVSRSTRIFQIDASVSSYHTVCTLIANTNYNSLSSNGIQVLSCSHFGSGGITKARLVYDSAGAYSEKYVYLEVYVQKANTKLTVRSSEGFGWTLQDIAAGSIPSGYTSKEYPLKSNNMVTGSINVLGSAYATKFYGDLDGTATYANYTHILPMPSANATYYVTFAAASNGKRMLCADTTLLYNPSTNTLTATNVKGNLYGAVQTTSTSTNASYYISFVNSSSTGMRYSYVDSDLYYNPSSNLLKIDRGKVEATNGFYETSDERLKDLQEDIEVNFSYLRNIPKKYYYWKDDATYTRHIGTSAQEVQKYYPELVNVDETGYLTMNYDKLSVVALKAIDVLHEEVTELKKENVELKERLARLEELILNK